MSYVPARYRHLRWKRYEDFDLDYRPRSYRDYADPSSVLLEGIRGEQRRRDARARLGAELLADRAGDTQPAHENVSSSARLGPKYLGGESLPDYLPGEVTIVRIAFRTLTWRVLEIRATMVATGYRYRIVDDSGADIVPLFDRSDDPLTLRQLLELIHDTAGLTGKPGLVLPVLAAVFPEQEKKRRSLTAWLSARGEPGDRSARVDAVRSFVAVESPFYPDLRACFRLRIDEWLLGRGELRDVLPIQVYRTNEDLFDCAPQVIESPEDRIDQLLRALWLEWRGVGYTDDPDTAIVHGRRARQLRRFMQDHLVRNGSLPAGEVTISEGPEGWPEGRTWSVDLDGLTETGFLIERILAEGEVADDLEIEWVRDVSSQLTVNRFGGRLYVLSADGLQGPFDARFLADEYLLELIPSSGTLVARLDWDSGGPGAGAGQVSAYHAIGKVWVTDDFGVHGPYDALDEAADHNMTLYWINGATTEIWDAEHGLVFERGKLYRPDVVERRGSICVPVEIVTLSPTEA